MAASKETTKVAPLYRKQELNFRTQYGELKERVRAEGALLPGTPGSLVIREGSGNPYWYRVFNAIPGKQVEEIVGRTDELNKLERVKQRIAFAEWMSKQVSALRKLGFQVTDKNSARVLVEMHNRKLFEAGLVLVGTLAYATLLNELGIVAISASTEDIDLARGSRLKLAIPQPFMATMAATGLPFFPVPGMPNGAPETAVKLPGGQGLRVDLLAPGANIGAPIRVPELDFAAQAVPFFDFLLDEAEPAVTLAGWQCIPVIVPLPARFLVHKLYSSLHRTGAPEKAEKDRRQAMTLTAVLQDEHPGTIIDAMKSAPAELRKELHKRKAAFLKHAELYRDVHYAWSELL
jgi:hypothetical protein